MNHIGPFERGMLAGVLLMTGAAAIHWFTSTAGREKTTTRTAAVAAQALVGLGGAVWLMLHA